jgi:hypothetical protein
MNTSAWIPVDGRDAAPAFGYHVNPAHIITACFWTDQAQQRVATIELTDGRKIDLRERVAIDAVGQVTRGNTETVHERPTSTCGRRAA